MSDLECPLSDLKCPLCDYVTSIREEITNHILQEHAQKRFELKYFMFSNQGSV